MLGEALLDAEARIGDLLKGIDKGKSYEGLTSSGGRKPILPEGITHKLSYQCQRLSQNLDLIEQVKAEAKENIFLLHL